MKPLRVVIRCDGSMEHLDKPVSMARICELIGASTLDAVALHHMGTPLHVMCLDDEGWETETIQRGNQLILQPVRARKPVNAKATELYLRNCMPGTTHQIVGDVVVLPDSDYE